MDSSGRYRWRLRARDLMPYWLWFLVGWPGQSPQDCGDHEWFNHDDAEEQCFHCTVGRRPRPS